MKYYLPFLLLFSFVGHLTANNIQVGVPVMVNPSPIEQHVYLEFDLSWDNSWRTSVNYDAAWVFLKFKDNSGVWQHAYLDANESLHSIQNDNGISAEIKAGLSSISGTDRCMGVFLQRQSNGTGNINWQNIRLKWNYGENGVANHETVEVRVFAIEMVYVPQGGFSIGDGASFSRFHAGGDINSSFLITDAPVNLSNSTGGLWALGAWDTPFGTLSNAYPTGYNAFYCMKYNITQKQYVAFLNTLTRAQQQQRTATNIGIGVESVTHVFVMSDSETPLHRNGIRCDASISPDAPVVFYCDLNNNGIMNETDDGQHITCNYLSWGDGVAYASWAGLRPITDTEYEKACRGTQTPVSGEYAWGTTGISGATAITNAGESNEVLNSNANCAYSNAAGVQGPVRAGAFATASSSRVESGATYYGIMEMSGNLWERIISLGSAAGRNFTGLHGTGQLNSSGQATENFWPGENAIGSGFRGGHWRGTVHNAKVSGRDNASFESATRNELFGFRAVRSEM